MRPKIWLALLIALTLAFSLAACGGNGGVDSRPSEPEQPEIQEPDPEYPVTVGSYFVNARPGRVLSLAPAITEKLCDLGFQSRLTGISRHCDFPPSITGLPRYGTAMLPSLNEILDAAPHLVIFATRPPADAMETLLDAGIDVVVLPSYHSSLAELLDTYLALSAVMEGRTTGTATGERFASEMQARIGEIAAIPPEEERDEPKKALYLRRLDFTVATGDTLEGELLERVGFINIAADQKNWTFDPDDANSQEGRAAFNSVDIIFCDERDVTIKMLEQSAFYKGLPAVLKDYFLYIDCTAFERQSLRMLDELELMARQK